LNGRSHLALAAGSAQSVSGGSIVAAAGGSQERARFLGQRLRRRVAKAEMLEQAIQLSETITGDGAAIFRRACWMDLEGIVSKRIGSRYVSGRTRAWLKTKNPDFQRS
jgi:ATP-dependent DNA ligase